jgi:serine/threonine protein kinase
MSLVCPSCDVSPAPDAKTCTACGAKLVDTTDTLIGTVLDGRFELKARLGSGAMGVVYRATQLSIGRDVAVKMLTAMNNVAMVKRFFREAKIASTLSHPNTVQIIEFGQTPDGRVYLVMELVKGRTLLDEISEGAMASRRVCRIGIQLCDALEAAHKLSIVHRDLKPENVMLGDNDHVKILDFGIARLLDDVSLQLTGAGLAAGTPNYMAPEVLAEAVDPAPPQDMYALGVVLAELAIGGAFWQGGTIESLLVEKTTARTKALDKVPGRLRGLVAKLLADDPAARPTAADTRKQLRDIDRVATDPVGIAPTQAPLKFDAQRTDLDPDRLVPDKLELVPLDAHTVPEPTVPAPPPAPVAVVPSFEPAPMQLEIDDEYVAERSRKLVEKAPADRIARAAAPVDRNVPKRSFGGVVFLLLLVLGAGAGGYYYYSHRETPASYTAKVDKSHGVSIKIVGAPGTVVSIDGVKAGKVPLTLQRKPSKKLLLLTAPGVSKQITPDHDQTVDMSRAD